MTRPTSAERQAMREEHSKSRARGLVHATWQMACLECGQEMPCDCTRLLDALDEAEARIKYLQVLCAWAMDEESCDARALDYLPALGLKQDDWGQNCRLDGLLQDEAEAGAALVQAAGEGKS